MEGFMCGEETQHLAGGHNGVIASSLGRVEQGSQKIDCYCVTMGVNIDKVALWKYSGDGKGKTGLVWCSDKLKCGQEPCLASE